MCFEALEQTLRLRLVSGPVDKKFFFLSRNSLSHTVDLKGVSLRVSLLIHLHACKITPNTVFAVDLADNVKNNKTRGTVFFFK